MFDSIFELKEKMNIFVAKVEFILNIVLICCLALKKSGKNWPHITKKEIDDQTVHFLEIVGVENWFNNQSIEKMLNQAKVRLDEEYVRRQSFWFDFRILWLTAIKVVRRDGVTH